ncbi:uncharacterized protein LOC119656290 [Hermetia illucens]|uniref:uncharacterized protein LOC119656290 n=1 Tax=Hermetia illucens TaxID=343691 RepID=UPI0018CC2938|nr:uncharacterized protein LOC119656290 [Hermetia illucens]
MEMTYRITNGIRLASICRICLRSGQCLHPVIDSVVPNFHAPPIAVIQLWKIFDELLLSHGPNFPDSICGDCLHSIQSHYLFMLKCEEADALLKGINQLNSPLTRFHRNIQNPTHSKSDPRKQCKVPDPIGKHPEGRITAQLRLAGQASPKYKRLRKNAAISTRKRELLRRRILRSSFRKIQSGRLLKLKTAAILNKNEEIIRVSNAFKHRINLTQQFIHHQDPYKWTCDPS